MPPSDSIEPNPLLIPEVVASRRWLALAMAVFAPVILGIGWALPVYAVPMLAPSSARGIGEGVRQMGLILLLMSVVSIFSTRASVLEKLRQGRPVLASSWLVRVTVLLAMGLAVWVLYIVLVRGLSPMSFAAWRLVPTMLLSALAVGLVAAAQFRRVGDERYCPRCGYRFGYANEQEGPELCSECGQRWKGLLIRGRRVGMTRTGAFAAALVCFVLAFFSVLFSGSMIRSAITPSIAARLVMNEPLESSFWFDAKDHLTDPAVVQRVLERLLAERERTGEWGTAHHFVSDVLRAPERLPPELVRRIVRTDERGLELSISAIAPPPNAAAQLMLGQDHRGVALLWYRSYLVDAFRVDDGPWQPLAPPLQGRSATFRVGGTGGLDITIPGTPGSLSGRRVTIRATLSADFLKDDPQGPAVLEFGVRVP